MRQKSTEKEMGTKKKKKREFPGGGRWLGFCAFTVEALDSIRSCKLCSEAKKRKRKKKDFLKKKKKSDTSPFLQKYHLRSGWGN